MKSLVETFGTTSFGTMIWMHFADLSAVAEGLTSPRLWSPALKRKSLRAEDLDLNKLASRLTRLYELMKNQSAS